MVDLSWGLSFDHYCHYRLSIFHEVQWWSVQHYSFLRLRVGRSKIIFSGDFLLTIIMLLFCLPWGSVIVCLSWCWFFRLCLFSVCLDVQWWSVQNFASWGLFFALSKQTKKLITLFSPQPNWRNNGSTQQDLQFLHINRVRRSKQKYNSQHDWKTSKYDKRADSRWIRQRRGLFIKFIQGKRQWIQVLGVHTIEFAAEFIKV